LGATELDGDQLAADLARADGADDVVSVTDPVTT
jgi:hypothetical protein